MATTPEQRAKHTAYSRRWREEHPEYRIKAKARYLARKEEIRVKVRAYYLANAQKMKEYRRVYYLKNKDKILAQTKAWQDAHPETMIAVKRKWREANPEKQRAATKRWAETHRTEWLLKAGRHRALKAKASGVCPIDAARARIAYFGGRCAYCGGPYECLDHVKPLSRGGSNWPANMRPSCTPCNSSKGSLLLSEWPGRGGKRSAA